jgi:hypothetical protein
MPKRNRTEIAVFPFAFIRVFRGLKFGLPRGGDSSSGSFCSGSSCVKKRNPEIKRLMHERNHLEGIAEVYRKFLHVSIAYIMIDSCMQQFMVAGRW